MALFTFGWTVLGFMAILARGMESFLCFRSFGLHAMTAPASGPFALVVTSLTVGNAGLVCGMVEGDFAH
jgi:hypothetical protein